MNILVIGGGGREHAVIRRLHENPACTCIYALPGNAGMEPLAVPVPIAATDLAGIEAFVGEHPIDFAVVTPDDPLVLGLADRLRARGIPTFGPSAAAARIEGSKVFAKELMKKYGIPTASYEVFTDSASACAYLASCSFPIVIKADGLALGKGVVIAADRAEAEEACRSMLDGGRFGESGRLIVIEEYLEGPEVSVLAFTDGVTVLPMPSSMDHKRAMDGDRGANTGGMGTVAPNPFYTEQEASCCMETIFLPTVRAMAAEGCPFSGCLYFGLMLTARGPRVIEYNCRFGDPEAQVVLPLIETDLLSLMQATEAGTLADMTLRVKAGAAACVIVASGGYPGKYETGLPMTLPTSLPPDVSLAFAGVKRAGDGSGLITAGGRVCGVVAVCKTLRDAVDTAEAAAEGVRFHGAFHRRDIGARALAELEKGGN